MSGIICGTTYNRDGGCGQTAAAVLSKGTRWVVGVCKHTATNDIDVRCTVRPRPVTSVRCEADHRISIDHFRGCRGFATRDGFHAIYIMNADGSEQRSVTPDRSDHFQPAWSPDGQWIAYTQALADNGEIFLVNVTTGQQINLTRAPGDDDQPFWKP